MTRDAINRVSTEGRKFLLPMTDLSPEILWRSSRSGGSGGQNVNKVETAAEARWKVADTLLFEEEEKARLLQKLAHRISKDGFLSVRASDTRSQLENKSLALKRLQVLVEKALFIPQTRKATKPSKAAQRKRIEDKKHNAFRKALRQKPRE